MDSIAKKWMTDREVANYFGIGRSTVWSWVKNGALKAHKLGPRTTRFLQAEVSEMNFKN